MITYALISLSLGGLLIYFVKVIKNQGKLNYERDQAVTWASKAEQEAQKWADAGTEPTPSKLRKLAKTKHKSSS